jgi:hypothetical protein
MFTALAGMIVGAGSFFGALAVIDFFSSPSASPPEVVQRIDTVDGLKTKLIYDVASLRRAANSANLENSESLKSALDVVERLPDGQIRLAGWAADIHGNGTPVRILAFAKGKAVLDAETNGERPDVTAALKLEPSLARNVKFELKAACNPREALVVAAATKKNTYTHIRTTTCP